VTECCIPKVKKINVAVFKTPRQTGTLKAVHDFPLNALEIVKSTRNDSLFFSNLNQMNLVKLKLGFQTFAQR
jgi:hypothetical protein